MVNEALYYLRYCQYELKKNVIYWN